MPASANPGGGYVEVPLGAVGTAHAINNGGDVVGYGGSTGAFTGFRYRNGELVEIIAAGTASTSPVEINDAGVVFGSADLYNDGGSSAFQWTNGVFTDLTPYSEVGAALEANNRGDVLGYHTAYRWAMWTHRGDTAEFIDFRPNGINDRGDVVGQLNGLVAVLHGGEIETLGITGSGRAISNNGFIAGSWTGPDGDTRAFIWRNGVMTDIGHVPGGTMTVARAVNSHGTVVGYSRVNGTSHAFVWSNGTMTDLTPTGTGLAYDINDAGILVGTADGQAVMWKPTTP